MLNVEKLIQACGYILKKYGGRLNYTKLTKLLYLADKEALKESLVTISGDEYVCMTNGPVLSGLYDLIRNKYRGDMNAQSLWNARFMRDGYELVYIPSDYPNGKMSAYEKEVLDRIDERYHQMGFSDLISLVHDKAVCPEWSDPGQGSASPLSLCKVLESVGYGDDEITWFLEEKETFGEEHRQFDGLAAL
jgi:hypothetical protein